MSTKTIIIAWLLSCVCTTVSSWHVFPFIIEVLGNNQRKRNTFLRSSVSQINVEFEYNHSLFHDFCNFLIEQQSDIILQLESLDGAPGAKFTKDCWGKFDATNPSRNGSIGSRSGGITRVLQGGHIIEKGACSLTVIEQGILSQERATAIQSRQRQLQQQQRQEQHAQGDYDPTMESIPPTIHEGDTYSAAALSIVLHSRSPFVPTFRSDVRIFVVSPSTDSTKSENPSPSVLAWFGGGADLTPYFLDEDDVTQFHRMYQNLTNSHILGNEFTYDRMKEACDDYFYLPARSEHRGTGGIFFDDMPASLESLAFVQDLAQLWVPSWKPIVNKHRNKSYSDHQKQWQLLRRGRYLEFNLLYDRGVKFGLANANPRVEGVMVSAPPLIAWEYNHVVEPESSEAKLLEVLKSPRSWV